MTVILPYDPTWKPLAWAKENCPSYITNEIINTGIMKPRMGKVPGPGTVPGGWVNHSNVVYYFSDERDATFFALKWL